MPLNINRLLALPVYRAYKKTSERVGKETMNSFSLVLIYNKETKKILLCKSDCCTYDRVFDFICAERMQGENGLECAYRELQNATGLTEDDITLQHIFDFTYVLDRRRLQVFAGSVSQAQVRKALRHRENSLLWADVGRDLCDDYEFFNGNCISHILSSICFNPATGLFEGSGCEMAGSVRPGALLYYNYIPDAL